MHTQKVAITIPGILLKEVDAQSRKKGVSRSRYIAQALQEKIVIENQRSLTEAYDRVFSDEAIRKEQAETAAGLEGSGNEGGQEW